jgi:hypothetical protein
MPSPLAGFSAFFLDIHSGKVCVSNGHIQDGLVQRLNRALEEESVQ